MSRLSDLQHASLSRCLRAAENGLWYRAAGSGERVTLASLWRHGYVERRAWRGVEGEPDAAHEYRASRRYRDNWDRVCSKAVRVAR
jgi:hypothetical protein